MERATAAAESGADDDPPSPYDHLENQIDALVSQRKYTEAIDFMEKLKRENLGGNPYYFEVDLGDAYASIGNFEEARISYQRVADSGNYPPETKKKAEAGLVEVAKIEGIKESYDLIEANKAELALAKAGELRSAHPEDVEVEMLYAQALVSNRRHREALPALEMIKRTHYMGQAFPAQDAMAESLLATGRLEEAKAAYDELAVDPTVKPSVRQEAIRASSDIDEMKGAGVALNIELLSEGEGDGSFFRAEARAPVGADTLAGVKAWYYDVDLSEERSIKQDSGDFLGAVGFARHYLAGGLTYAEGRVGGGEHGDATWGVSYGKERTVPSVYGYYLTADVNLPALDSLSMVALNGVEDRVKGEVAGPLIGRLEFVASLSLRRVDIDDIDIGDGVMAHLEIGQPIWENADQTASLNLAYRADYEEFDSEQVSARQLARFGMSADPGESIDLGSELVEPLWHPHGLYMSYERQMTDWMFFYTGGGLFYEFAYENFIWEFSVGTEMALNSKVDLVIEGAYYSEGTSASRGDGVVVGTAGLRMFY
jgi:Flp pilus assembly protein TadD